MIRAILAVVIVGLLLSPALLAQGAGGFTPAAGGKKDEKKDDEKKDDVKKDDEKKDDGKKDEQEKKGTPIDQMIRDLKALIAREKAKPEYDTNLVKELEAIVKSYERNRKPISLDDLTEEDRRRLEAEVRKKIEAERRERDTGGAGDGGGDWADRWLKGRVDRVLEGVELKDEQRPKVEELLMDFGKDVGVAYQNRDNKLVKDLKNDLEKSLKKVVGHRKAKDIMNEVNKQFGGWGRGGGRGGR